MSVAPTRSRISACCSLSAFVMMRRTPELLEVVGDEDRCLEVVAEVDDRRVDVGRDELRDDLLAQHVGDVGGGHLVLVPIDDLAVLVDEEDLAARVGELLEHAPAEPSDSDDGELLHYPIKDLLFGEIDDLLRQPPRSGNGERAHADPAGEHREDDDTLSQHGEVGREPEGQSDGAEGGECLEENGEEVLVLGRERAARGARRSMSRNAATATMASARRANIIPLLTESGESFLRSSRTSSRASDPRRIMTRTMKNVVVLIPPPVEAGDAPTYIRNIVNTREGAERVHCGIVSNPAVRGVTDWNSGGHDLLGGRRGRGMRVSHSNRR